MYKRQRPSGDTSITKLDKQQARALAEKYPGFQYLIVRGEQSYSLIRVQRGAGGTVEATVIDENVVTDESPVVAGDAVAGRPSWVPTQQRVFTAEQAEVMRQDMARIEEQIPHPMRQGRGEDWAVVALMAQDGTLVDLVEIPNAFELDAEGARAAVAQARELYGGADAYLVLHSPTHITDIPDFFASHGWGTYLSEQPEVRGHVLVGAGPSYAATRVKEYPIAPTTSATLRTLSI